jgi:hypothetical protein
MYSRTMPNKKKNKKSNLESLPDIAGEDALKAEMDRQHLGHLATEKLLKDPVGRAAQKRAKEQELEVEIEATNEARMRELLTRQGNARTVKSEAPWGISYLEQKRGPKSIRAAVRARRAQEAEQRNVREKQAEVIPLAMAKARQLTLSEGIRTAEDLKEAGVPYDTEIWRGKYVPQKTSRFTRSAPKKTARATEDVAYAITEWRKKQRLSDSELPKPDPDTRGWLLPINGRLDDSCSVVLMEDGRILTAYGSIKKAEKNETGELQGNHELYVQPDYYGNIEMRRETAKEAAMGKHDNPHLIAIKDSPDHIYSRVINGAFNSDIGLGPVVTATGKDNLASGEPKPTPTFGAYAILEREAAMQEALASLYYEKTDADVAA